jgi:hypothetical protein
MHVSMKCHPATPCDAIRAIEVEVERGGIHGVTLRYVASGTIANLLVPQSASPERRDGLWQHTCFEAFAQPVGGTAYGEFNFAPSLCWAAYQFDDCRVGMRPAEQMSELRIEVEADSAECQLTATVEFPGEGPWNVGLSAVIEETNGRKSYWALAHPPGKPDFHRADCFTLRLA